MNPRATIAIPVLNGAQTLEETLSAAGRQRLDGGFEVLVCDSGSEDGSQEMARRHGADLVQIAPGTFGHGRTRNLLMERARGDYVAFLTQDAVPTSEGWLNELVTGFSLAHDVGLTFGPYQPRPGASPIVQRELADWFGRLSPDGAPRVDRLDAEERDISGRELLGPRGFYTDANGCVARAAWGRVPFRDVAYAEDHLLAHDMLRAGFAKVFVPGAPVIHSHAYSPLGWLRRSFDEARAVRDIYGWTAPLDVRSTTLRLYGQVGGDVRWGREHGLGSAAVLAHAVRSLVHHSLRLAGAGLGGHHDRLPGVLTGRLSLERRGR